MSLHVLCNTFYYYKRHVDYKHIIEAMEINCSHTVNNYLMFVDT